MNPSVIASHEPESQPTIASRACRQRGGHVQIQPDTLVAVVRRETLTSHEGVVCPRGKKMRGADEQTSSRVLAGGGGYS